jgi:hypothetical protein
MRASRDVEPKPAIADLTTRRINRHQGCIATTPLGQRLQCRPVRRRVDTRHQQGRLQRQRIGYRPANRDPRRRRQGAQAGDHPSGMLVPREHQGPLSGLAPRFPPITLNRKIGQPKVEDTPR